MAIPDSSATEKHFRQKYGAPESTGWAPARRWRYDYFLPADRYEAIVESLVQPGCRWIDIGGGHDVFPENPTLARELVARCSRVVAVDPSANVGRNEFVHETVRSTLEQYVPDRPFDLATMRMVAEHVERPHEFVGALSRAVRPGATVVIFTVSLWAPVTVVSRLVPFRFHHTIKRLFWGGETEDTFPTYYRMNSRRTLARLLAEGGFDEERFLAADDLTVFGSRRWLNLFELQAWRTLKWLGIRYPEHCLIGIYRKRPLPASRATG